MFVVMVCEHAQLRPAPVLEAQTSMISVEHVLCLGLVCDRGYLAMRQNIYTFMSLSKHGQVSSVILKCGRTGQM